jgi:sulfonate transport system substrate-binding protein
MKKIDQVFLMALTTILMLVMLTGSAVAEQKKIRIGWQPNNGVMAEITQTLIKTDILERNGLVGEFIPFTLGAPLNEALVTNAVDVGFTGDLPAIAAIAVGAPVVVIGSPTFIRTTIMTVTQSNVKVIADLKGRKIYGPSGTAAFMATRSTLEKVGIIPGKDVEFVNLSVTDITAAIGSGQVENFFMFDPLATYFEQKGLARVVAENPYGTAVLLMRRDFYKNSPDTTERFLKASKEALLFCAQNHDLCDKWFIESPSASAFNEKITDVSASYDPQWNAKSLKDIHISLTPEMRKTFFATGRQAFELKILQKDPPMQDNTDTTIADKVDAMTWEFNPKTVKILVK